MRIGKTGHRGTRGSQDIQGEKGDSGGDSVFIKVSNQEVYAQIKNLQTTNDAGHLAIISKIDALEKSFSCRVDTIEKDNATEHEKIKGSVLLGNLSIAGVSAVVIGLVWIVLAYIGVKP